MRYLFIIFSGSLLMTQDLLPLRKKPNTKRTHQGSQKKKEHKHRKAYLNPIHNQNNNEYIIKNSIEKTFIDIDPNIIKEEGLQIINTYPIEENTNPLDSNKDNDRNYIVIDSFKLPLPNEVSQEEGEYLINHIEEILLLKINDAMLTKFSLNLKELIINEKETKKFKRILSDNIKKIDAIGENNAIDRVLHNKIFIKNFILFILKILTNTGNIKTKKSWWDKTKIFFGKKEKNLTEIILNFIEEHQIYNTINYFKNKNSQEIAQYLYANLAYSLIHDNDKERDFISTSLYNDISIAASLPIDFSIERNKPLNFRNTYESNQILILKIMQSLLALYAKLYNEDLPYFTTFISNNMAPDYKSNLINPLLFASKFLLIATILAHTKINFVFDSGEMNTSDQQSKEFQEKSKEFQEKLAQRRKKIEDKLDEEGGEELQKKLAQEIKEIIDKMGQEAKEIIQLHVKEEIIDEILQEAKEIIEIKEKLPKDIKSFKGLKEELTQQSEELKELKKLQELKKLEGLKKLEELKEKLTQQSKDFKEK